MFACVQRLVTQPAADAWACAQHSTAWLQPPAVRPLGASGDAAAADASDALDGSGASDTFEDGDSEARRGGPGARLRAALMQFGRAPSPAAETPRRPHADDASLCGGNRPMVPSLAAWAAAPGVSARAAADRRDVAHILSQAALTQPNAGADAVLVVRGHIDLRAYSWRKALPPNVHITGNLYLSDCDALVRLPVGLMTDGNLSVYCCGRLTALSDRLRVTGDFSLYFCTALTDLAEDVTLGGDTHLCHCPKLQHLPASWSYGGSLSVSISDDLPVLPEGLRVGCDLRLKGEVGPLGLPQTLHVGQSMTLHSSNLKALPAHLVVKHLTRNKCAASTQLPEDLSVQGDPHITGCWALSRLPEDLTFGRTSPMYQTLIAAQHAGRQGALGDVYITQQTDAALTRLPQARWRNTLATVQRAYHPEIKGQNFAKLIRAVGQVAPAGRAALLGTWADMASGDAMSHGRRTSAFCDLCATPKARWAQLRADAADTQPRVDAMRRRFLRR